MLLHFFGLANPINRVILHQELYDMVYYSEGRFTWTELYEMPIWLRQQYKRMLVNSGAKEKEKQDNAIEKAKRKGKTR